MWQACMGGMLLTLFMSVVFPPHKINGVAFVILENKGGLLVFFSRFWG